MLRKSYITSERVLFVLSMIVLLCIIPIAADLQYNQWHYTHNKQCGNIIIDVLMITNQCSRGVKWFEISIEEKGPFVLSY
jgi:membrane protein YdbS with pleckstrin-like domain